MSLTSLGLRPMGPRELPRLREVELDVDAVLDTDLEVRCCCRTPWPWDEERLLDELLKSASSVTDAASAS
jgi:hypothetical protein